MSDPLDSSQNPFLRVAEYFVKVGEAVALAVFFRVAADNTNSLLIEIMAVLAGCVVGAYAGTPVGLLIAKLDRIKTRKLWVAFLVALPIALLWGWAALETGRQISNAVKQIAEVGK